MSTESFVGNRLRLDLLTFTYMLAEGLGRKALQGTEWERAQQQTFRLRLFRITASVRVTARKVSASLARSYPWPELFLQWHMVLCGSEQAATDHCQLGAVRDMPKLA